MTSIAFIVAYFGKLPDTFAFWLKSCKQNPSIDWLLYTDDTRNFDYPDNVHIVYTKFTDIIERLQKLYDFPLGIRSPKKLCDFKVAYGELFKEELTGYDFWGYCDLDILWGDMRSFYTEELLNKYDKIGFTGNCSIFRNTESIRTMYRMKNHREEILYKTYFSDDIMHCFDEVGLNDIFIHNNIPYYSETNFSNLASNRHNFYMCFLPKKERHKNKSVVYCWDNGRLFHIYTYKNKICFQEIMFLHFLGSRRLEVHIDNKTERFLIVPNEFIPYENLSLKLVKVRSKPHWLRYLYRGLKTKSIRGKIYWMSNFLKYHYWCIVHCDRFTYWSWTDYDRNKQDRINIINNQE